MALQGVFPRERPEMDLNGLDVYQQGPLGPTSVEGSGGNRIGQREKDYAASQGGPGPK